MKRFQNHALKNYSGYINTAIHCRIICSITYIYIKKKRNSKLYFLFNIASFHQSSYLLRDTLTYSTVKTDVWIINRPND